MVSAPGNRDARRHVIIVDGFGAARHLVAACRRRGLGSLLLWSSPEIAHRWRFLPPAGHDQIMAHRGSTAETVSRLDRFRIACVIAGQPSGFHLAAILEEALGVTGNSSSMDPASPSRAAPPQRPAGAGPAAGLAEAAEGSVPGVSFIFNSVSCQGRHWFSDIWRAGSPPDGAETCRDPGQVLLIADDPAILRLYRPVGEALSAWGPRSGPAHTRILLTSDGPVVERCSPGFDPFADPDIHSACLGADPFELTLDALLDPPEFRRKTADPYVLRRHAVILQLSPAGPGTVRDLTGIGEITRLPSCLYLVCACRVGERAPAGAAGHVVLAGPSPEGLEWDCRRIRDLETAERFIEIGPAPPIPQNGIRSPLAFPGRPRPPRPSDVSALDRYLDRPDYYQSANYAAAMSARGWDIVHVNGAAVFIRRLPSGVFAKAQRPSRLDPLGLARLKEAAGIAEFVFEPAARLTLVEPGRETSLIFDPANPGEWMERLETAGFTLGKRRYAPSRNMVVPLGAGETEILARFAPKRRQEVRRALESRIRYDCLEFSRLGAEDRRELAELHARWTESRTFRGHDQPFLDAVTASFREQGFCVLARREGALAGAFYVLRHDGVAHYYYTFSDPRLDQHHLGAGGIAMAMLHARAAGCDFFDLGAALDERYPHENQSWSGFSFFKKQFRPFDVYHPPSLLLTGPPGNSKST